MSEGGDEFAVKPLVQWRRRRRRRDRPGGGGGGGIGGHRHRTGEGILLYA